MGRSPCCDDNTKIKKGPWTPEEDKKLVDYVDKHGHGSWRALPKLAGLNRCGKSCRLRWANYLRPDIKRGKFSDDEEQVIVKLHSVLGNKWSTIAQRLPGRTDNEIKNYWNTNLRKKLLQRGIDPVTHRPRTDHLNLFSSLPQLLAASNHLSLPLNNALSLQNRDINEIAKAQLLQSLLQVLSTCPPPPPPLHQPLYNPFASTFEGLSNFPINFFPNPNPYLSNGSSLDVYPPSQLTQTTVESDALSGDYKFDNNDQFRALWPSETTAESHVFDGDYKLENSLPALVSDSRDCSTINQMEKTNSNVDMSKASSSSASFETWGDIMGDEAGETYWKGILDQVASPSWPMS